MDDFVNLICNKLNTNPSLDELADFLRQINVDKFEYKTRSGTWTFIPDKPLHKWNQNPIIVAIEKTSGFIASLKDGLFKGTI